MIRWTTAAAIPFLAAIALAGCSRESSSPEPVEACTKAGEVCRLDGDRLGTCVAGCDPAKEGCEHDCITCAPQD